MPEIKTIHDKDSDMLPSVTEMRASQKQGSTGDGLPENCTGKLNETIGMQVEIKS